MIRFITGLPGAGKSLRLVQVIEAFLAEGRNVYVSGLDGLQEFGWQSLPDPRNWQDLPDGSVLIVDECQKWFPTRRTAEPPEFVRSLSEHRHHGLDFVLATQHPTMVDKYVRTLCGQHEHVIRQFGMQASRIITWTECQEDPQSLATRQRGTEALWKYPAENFPLYKSATMHTVKTRIPLRLKLIPLLVVAAIGLLWYGVNSIIALAHGGKPTTSAAVGAASGSVPVAAASSGSAKAPRYANAAEYVKAQVPRVAGMPWSAPLFDDRQPVSQPDIYCIQIEGKDDEPRRCQCYSEQVTRMAMPLDRCLDIARNGVYNPFRQPAGSQQQQQSQPGQQADMQQQPQQQATRAVMVGEDSGRVELGGSSSGAALQVPHGTGAFRGH